MRLVSIAAMTLLVGCAAEPTAPQPAPAATPVPVASLPTAHEGSARLQ